jgi:hypothetical protein
VFILLNTVFEWDGEVAQCGKVWWLNGSALDCCPAVPGSNPASPQPTADCQSSAGLPPGIALACELTSVRGDRRENYEITKKHIKKKKVFKCTENSHLFYILDRVPVAGKRYELKFQ